MQRIVAFTALLCLCVSCSSFSYKTEIKETSGLKELASSGILFRLSKNSSFDNAENVKNLDFWLEGYKKKGKVISIKNPPDEISIYGSNADRFLQTSINSEFLKYKSIGVVKLYLRKNAAELNKVFSENGLDSLIIYEIDSGYSTELHYIDFNSVIVVIDREYNVLYLDYQDNSYNVDEFDQKILRKHLLDKLSCRLLERLTSLNYIEK